MSLLAQRRCLDKIIFNLIQSFLREVSHFSLFLPVLAPIITAGYDIIINSYVILKPPASPGNPHRIMLGRADALIPVTLIKDASFSKKQKEK